VKKNRRQSKQARARESAGLFFERAKRPHEGAWGNDFLRRHGALLALLLILIAGAALRLLWLDGIPPALHADEAPNAWNAYTLLKTGLDQYGVHWPIFYTRAFGDNRSTLYIYMIMPFQALGGLNVWTTRLPAVFASVLTIFLIDYVGARLFGRAVGLSAAVLLAFNPWHIQMSRWGHEAAIVPLLVILPVAALLWANLPLGGEAREPRPVRAGFAGAVAGIVCYGYQVVRPFIPLLLVFAVLLNFKAWWRQLQTRRGVASVGALVIAGALTFGPLLYKHLTDPEIGRRGQIQGVIWKDADSTGQKAAKVLARYAGHFAPQFLFISGDHDPALSPPPGFGLFFWSDLPLMLMGIFVCCKQARWSPESRLLLLWLVLYPVGDLIYEHPSMHALRSLPGLPGLVLLTAVGVVALVKRLWTRSQLSRAAVCAAALLVIILNVRFIDTFFSDAFMRQKARLNIFMADVLQAAQWLRPHLDGADAVFITGSAIHPDIVSLVGLSYDPKKWFAEPRELVRGPLKNGAFKDAYVYPRYGKIYFLFDEDASAAALNALSSNGRQDHVILIMRPGEVDLGRPMQPVLELRKAGDQVTLWIVDTML
jgi:4-amino-4-deoxy-L-arabinose transferase-like glycosyltransferase